MNQLIVIKNAEMSGAIVETVEARDLWEFLGSKQNYADWFKSRTDKYSFVEGIDYIEHIIMTQYNQIDTIDHFITLDMAKELSMVERTMQGKMARQYFIECEKVAKKENIPALPNYQEALRQLADSIDLSSKQQLMIEAQKPAVAFVDRYVEARSSKCLSDVAKLLKRKPQEFIQELSNGGVIFKRSGSWIPYQPHIDAGRFTVTTGESNGHAFQQTRVEPAGIVWLANRYSGQ